MYKKIGPVLLVFAVYGSPAQQTLMDSAASSQDNARDFAQNLYLKSREGQAALYNGILHYNYLSTIEGTG